MNGGASMNEKAFIILCLLAGDNNIFKEPIDNAISAVTVDDLYNCGDPALDCKTTVYRHLQYLLDIGMVKHGIRKGRAYTYYISKQGINYIASI